MKKALFTGILAAALIAAACLPAFCVLAVTEEGSGELLYASEANNRFSISFLHSVNRSEVEEVYTSEPAGLTVRECLYHAYGAGVASTPEDGGRLYTRKDGVMVLTDIDRYVGELHMTTGTISDHKLNIDGRVIPLRELTEPKTKIKIAVEYKSLLDVLVCSVVSNT